VIIFSIRFPSEVSKNVKPPPTNTLQGRLKKKEREGARTQDRDGNSGREKERSSGKGSSLFAFGLGPELG